MTGVQTCALPIWPAIVFAPNKTLAAQLYSEFREFFPQNAVEYFVSYYDYYQPEAYVPTRDLFIEKDSSINEHIEQMRLSATKSLLEREDAVIVAVRHDGATLIPRGHTFLSEGDRVTVIAAATAVSEVRALFEGHP